MSFRISTFFVLISVALLYPPPDPAFSPIRQTRLCRLLSPALTRNAILLACPCAADLAGYTVRGVYIWAGGQQPACLGISSDTALRSPFQSGLSGTAGRWGAANPAAQPAGQPAHACGANPAPLLPTQRQRRPGGPEL